MSPDPYCCVDCAQHMCQEPYHQRSPSPAAFFGFVMGASHLPFVSRMELGAHTPYPQ